LRHLVPMLPCLLGSCGHGGCGISGNKPSTRSSSPSSSRSTSPARSPPTPPMGRPCSPRRRPGRGSSWRCSLRRSVRGVTGCAAPSSCSRSPRWARSSAPRCSGSPSPKMGTCSTGRLSLPWAGCSSSSRGSSYNAILLKISTPETYGRISGFAWGMGYLGGVIALVLTLFGFVLGVGLLGLPTENGENFRGIALLCAGWFLVFGLPLLILAPADEPREDDEKFNLAMAYRELFRRIAHLWRNERTLLHFFAAAAVYRDGLSAVFALA